MHRKIHVSCFLGLILSLVCLNFDVSVAHAQRYRHEDLELLSQNYQERIVQSAHVTEVTREALRLWQVEINRILALPKAKRPSEKDLHAQFFDEVFGEALGFGKRHSGDAEWSLQSEFVTDVDATRPDGVLGFLGHDEGQNSIQVVIELKGPGTDLDLRQNRKQDRRTPIDQAFSYAHKFDAVEWVIVSNYSELRLYHKRSSKYALHFDLTRLVEDEHQLKLFVLLLSKPHLVARNGVSTTSSLYNARVEELETITDAFYDDYGAVRLATAQNIIANNQDVSIDLAVTYAQTILDRILFTAFLEDLNLIPAETLEKAYQARNDFAPAPIWENFKGLFKAMDQGNDRLSIPAYNGGLFRSHPEILDLVLEDDLFLSYKTLADYDFLSDLRVNILGHVFEKSITDIAALKAQLRGEENTDTRRHDEAAFYTPDLVTSYIVEKTIGAHLKGVRGELGLYDLPEIQKEEWLLDQTNKTRQKHIAFWEAYAARLKALKIVDPSCGSGAFLVAAFDYLEEEGRRVNRELERLNAPRLFSHWDRDILKNNLYGVDLSPEAANITRLSLWLKIAKNKEPLVALDHNIRAGNSVVRDKVYASFTAFNWEEAFPEVSEQGGFDIVLGNPPYVRHELIKDIKPALKEQFEAYQSNADLYVYFYELGYDLLKNGGYLGYISSHKWMKLTYGKSLRAFLKNKTSIEMLIDLGEDDLFDDATTYTNMLAFKKQKPEHDSRLIVSEAPFGEETITLKQSYLASDHFNIEPELFFPISTKIEEYGKRLSDWKIEINSGVKTGFNEAFFISQAMKEELVTQSPLSQRFIKPVLRGADMEKWHARPQDEWLVFIPTGWTDRNRGDEEAETYIRKELPALYEHLRSVGDAFEARKKLKKQRQKGLYERDDQGDYWWELRPCQYCPSFEEHKVIYSKTAKSGQFSIDENAYYQNNTSYHIVGDNLHFLTAMLNSDLIYWYLAKRGSLLRGRHLEFVDWLVKLTPIPELSDEEKKPLEQLSEELHALSHQKQSLSHKFTGLLMAEQGIESLSEKLENWHDLTFKAFLSELKKKKVILKGEEKEDWHERFIRVQKEIVAIETQISDKERDLNESVEQLYGLTAEEIAYYRTEIRSWD